MFSCMVDHKTKEKKEKEKNLTELSILPVLAFAACFNFATQNYYSLTFVLFFFLNLSRLAHF